MTTTEIQETYLDQRLKKFGIEPHHNFIHIVPRDYPPQDKAFFTSDANGDIQINYFSPSGGTMVYESGKHLKDFYRTRYKEPKIKNDKEIRYDQPFGSGIFPFCPKSLIDKFKTKQKIKTLVITEGEFKSFVASIHLESKNDSISFIGIGGIQNFTDKKQKQLDQYIREIISVCQVENIILLFDADCLKVEYKPDKDLHQRLFLFYTAVKNFKELTKPLNIDVYFAHILESYLDTAKGIDDLIIDQYTNQEELLNDLISFDTGIKKYVHIHNISANSSANLQKYFCINDVNDFYEKYQDKIQDNDFIFNHCPYEIKDGKIKAKGNTIFHKTERYLSEKYNLRKNEITLDIEVKSNNEDEYSLLNLSALYIELQKANINISDSKLTALLLSPFVVSYNPFLEYFDSLQEWDNETDYIEALCNCITLKNKNEKDLFYKHLKKHLVRLIATALDNNVFNKQCFTLAGGQNAGKTTLCRWFCPPQLKDYIIEDLEKNKDSLIALTRNFIYNIDELANHDKSEIDWFKSLFSRTTINARPPYERKNIIMYRRCSFFATTNKTELLVDETGSVRWLIFEIADNGIDYIKYMNEIDINNIYSQAYSLYKSGFKFELTRDEIQENEIRNVRYQKLTVERELIKRNFSPSTKEEFKQCYSNSAFMTATDILKRLTEITENQVRINSVNIGRALKMLDFKNDRDSNGVYGYFVRETLGGNKSTSFESDGNYESEGKMPQTEELPF